jgi:hypothetical protein
MYVCGVCVCKSVYSMSFYMSKQPMEGFKHVLCMVFMFICTECAHRRMHVCRRTPNTHTHTEIHAHLRKCWAHKLFQNIRQYSMSMFIGDCAYDIRCFTSLCVCEQIWRNGVSNQGPQKQTKNLVWSALTLACSAAQYVHFASACLIPCL